MDEGLNTYVQFRYEAEKYRYNSIFGDEVPADLKKLPPDQFWKLYMVLEKSLPMHQQWKPRRINFQIVTRRPLSYVKTALWLYMLEASVEETVDLALQNYLLNGN
jgi:hypothetical protein